MVHFAGLTYSTGNIGDDIQTLAVSQHLPRIDAYLDRDRLSEFSSPSKHVVVMNGWFNRRPFFWPPSDSVLPVFVGFHAQTEARKSFEKHVEYFKAHEPIGCRDPSTAEWLRSLGVRAYTTYCATLTFRPRAKIPAAARPMIVDARTIAIPRAIRKAAVRVSHRVLPIGTSARLSYATGLLDFYRDNASLVITTRLHCAFPCLAMNIPVVFFGDRGNTRTNIVEDVGGKIYDKKLHKRSMSGLLGRLIESIDWSPKPVDVSAFATRIEEDIRSRLAQYS